MTKQDPLKFEDLYEERITRIFSYSLWNDQAWVKPDSISQFSEQCNGYRKYVYQTQSLRKAKHSQEM